LGVSAPGDRSARLKSIGRREEREEQKELKRKATVEQAKF
jgi:hypothetical protein